MLRRMTGSCRPQVWVGTCELLTARSAEHKTSTNATLLGGGMGAGRAPPVDGLACTCVGFVEVEME